MLDKIENAKKLIEEQIKQYSNPIVFSSFGKDSMVMLDLIKSIGIKLPIIFHKEPFEPKKYEFANKVINDNDYVVYDYPPIYSAITKRNDDIEIINFHQVKGHVNYMPTGIRKPNGGDFLCGLKDIYNKPHANFDFPWDLGFIGHKSTDKDPILGNVPLISAGYTTKSCDFVFPLKEFSDEDVWNYTIEHNLPINDKRYNKDNNWKEFEDITYNPDYFHACVSCMDRDEKHFVHCPKLNSLIPNISSFLYYIDPISLPYVER